MTEGRELRQVTLRQEREPAQSVVLILGGGGSRRTGPGLAFAPDGMLLAAPGPSGGGDSGNTLVLIDAAAGKVLRKIELTQSVISLAFSPDGRTLATENTDRTVTLWETASGKQRGDWADAATPRPNGGGRNVLCHRRHGRQLIPPVRSAWRSHRTAAPWLCRG